MKTKSNEDFVAFILTNGRPNKVITYESLKKAGYTGRVVLVVDDEDKELENYKKKFGDQVYVFSKEEVAKTFDEADNFNDRRAIVYARNACFEIAKELGYKYFIQLDDDYTNFYYMQDENLKFKHTNILDLDDVFRKLLKFFLSIPNLCSVAMAQGGDFIGGAQNKKAATEKKLMRKCMNSFICSTDRPFKFIGRVNEDVNTYTLEGSRGSLFLTVTNLKLSQVTTQKSAGGMTGIYKDNGTYYKSFYSVMMHPSGVSIALMGHNARLHHSVKWSQTVPMILSESYKKRR